MARGSSDFPPRHAIYRARFFLERAEECNVDEREAFEANLEAAIVFGRTALLRLKSQYGKGPGKHPDWGTWWKRLLKDQSVVFFQEERNFILKEGPAKLNQIISVPPLRLDLLMEDNNPDPTGFRGHIATEADDLNSLTRAADLYYFENEQPPATATVRRHLERTTQLLADAEARFQT